jgi:hypothetical protein
MSLPYVILTFNADDLSTLPDEEFGVDGMGLRVAEVEEDDVDDGVSGIDENALVNVDVPVVGREDVIGEIGEWGVIGESESRSRRPTGRGGGNSRPRLRLVWIWWIFGVLALRDRLVLSGAMEGRDERSGNLAVKGGVGIPFE